MLKTVFGLLGLNKGDVYVDDDKPSQGQISQVKKSQIKKGQVSQVSKTLADTYRDSLSQSAAVKLTQGAIAIEDIDLVVEAAYKQVFGNTRLMESERLGVAESQLRDGNLTVKEFVRCLAKSDRYQALFWDKYPNVTVIELNFKHLLGRAPESYAEISEHIQILATGGFEAEINSYLDSDEYSQTFGDDCVPYLRGYDTRVGGSTVGFMHAFPLFGTASSSATSITSNGTPKLQTNLVRGLSSQIPAISVRPEPASIVSPAAFKPVSATTPTPADSKKSKKSRGQAAASVASNGRVPLDPASFRPPAPGQVIDGQVQIWSDPLDKAKLLSERYRDSLAGSSIVEFVKDSASVENADLVIEAAYKQVFGNAHLMESERLREAESQMREGQITVSDFIRKLALSDLYRAWFWEKYPNVTAIELNFQHLLGRPPRSYEELSEHIQIIAEGGFEAEIDSYLDSDEYYQAFGDYQVPYPRGYETQVGGNSIGFTYAFPLLGAACSSDKSNFGKAGPKLQTSLIRKTAKNLPPLRPIPESFPEELTVGPEPRIPKEIRDIAYDLWQKVERSPTRREVLLGNVRFPTD